jgi:hypothetical protein
VAQAVWVFGKLHYPRGVLLCLKALWASACGMVPRTVACCRPFSLGSIDGYENDDFGRVAVPSRASFLVNMYKMAWDTIDFGLYQQLQQFWLD